MTTTIGAARMSQLILRPTADELLDQLTDGSGAGPELDHIGLRFDELHIDAGSSLAGKTLGQIEVRGAHGYLVVGVRGADGTTVMHPPDTTMISVGDVVVVLGYQDDIPELATRWSPGSTPRTMTYRGVTTTT